MRFPFVRFVSGGCVSLYETNVNVETPFHIRTPPIFAHPLFRKPSGRISRISFPVIAGGKNTRGAKETGSFAPRGCSSNQLAADAEGRPVRDRPRRVEAVVQGP